MAKRKEKCACGLMSHARGMCQSCYGAWYRLGGSNHVKWANGDRYATQDGTRRSDTAVSKDGYCTIPDCPGGVKARGLCTLHYGRWYNKGDAMHHRPECSAISCRTKLQKGARYCVLHQHRLDTYGSPDLKPPERPICSKCQFYADKCPDCAECQRIKVCVSRKRYREAHPDRIRKQRRQYGKANPEIARAARRRKDTADKIRRQADPAWRQRKNAMAARAAQAPGRREVERKWRNENVAYLERQRLKHRQRLKNETPIQMGRRQWTEGEDQMALRNDLTLREIAWSLGRPYKAVAQRRHYLRNRTPLANRQRAYIGIRKEGPVHRTTGDKLRRWTDTEDQTLIRLIANGLAKGQISHALGRSQIAVASRLTLLRKQGLLT